MVTLVLLPLLALAAGAPQYQPLRFNDVSGQYKQEVLSNNNDGQYHPDNSGTYIHSDDPYKYQGGSSSIYNGGIGAYTPTKSFDGQYKSDNAGAYNNDDGQYHPDNSGAYNSDNSGQYKHSDDPYKHQGDSSGTGTLGFSRPSITTNIIKPVTVPVTPIGVSKPIQGSTVGYNDNKNYAIIREVEQVLEDGYHYIYETENGILAEEEGHLENKGQETEFMKAKGFYKYTGPDDVEYVVEYTVDAENGFVPKGAHIPQ